MLGDEGYLGGDKGIDNGALLVTQKPLEALLEFF